MWFDLPAALASRHRIVAYDRRSFGASVHEPLSTASHHIDDAAAILASLDAPAIVVGWSRGATFALELGLACPDLVAGLVLVEPPLGASRHASIRLLAGVLAAKLWSAVGAQTRGAEAFLRAALRSSSARGDALAGLPADLRREIARDARSIIAELAGGTGEATSALARLAPKGIWLVGEDSEPSLRICASRAKPHLPHIDFRTVGGSTHLMARDRPDAIVEAVAELSMSE
jgi:pimeloyl-ACP methyl ester carboxylesterase